MVRVRVRVRVRFRFRFRGRLRFTISDGLHACAFFSWDTLLLFVRVHRPIHGQKDSKTVQTKRRSIPYRQSHPMDKKDKKTHSPIDKSIYKNSKKTKKTKKKKTLHPIDKAIYISTAKRQKRQKDTLSHGQIHFKEQQKDKTTIQTKRRSLP